MSGTGRGLRGAFAMCVVASVVACAVAMACGSFEDGDSTSPDAGADGAAADGASAPDASGIDAGAPNDGAIPDAGVDGRASGCVVKPGIGCEDGGCPLRCPPNDLPVTNDVLEVLPRDGGGIDFRNTSDCHHYACVHTVGDAGSYSCTSPKPGLRLRVCSTSNPSTCGVGDLPWSISLGPEFSCANDACTYSCEQVAD
jgi:hypothetical protein